MSNIYNLDIKGLRKALIDFHKTLYGRTAFFLAFFIPILAFLALVGFTITLFIKPEDATFIAFYSAFGVFVLSFIIGNAYYYRELRDFMRNK
ncbi:hypothetical protein IJS18_00535 [Candidatus Saccharibacteria bacterium]|nr:hypothetical protein [Candidatus Saccharibacteria bacterium]